MSDSFSLSSLVQKVLAESAALDVKTLTSEVLLRIRKPQLRAALEQALPLVISAELGAAIPSVQPPSQGEAAPSRPFDGSWGKVKQYRDWYSDVKAHSHTEGASDV